MPLLLHRSPAAGRALTWRGSSRDTAACPVLTPLAAVRHLFRDHSTDSQHGASDKDRNHTHPRRQQPNHQNQRHHHRKGSELSTDWPSLYLAAKLAYWSGLCYYPYDTIPRTLQEEGLKLVAYGRTSYTCWYVADGCVDLGALRRRAFPQRQEQQPLPSGPSAFGTATALSPSSSSDETSAVSSDGGDAFGDGLHGISGQGGDVGGGGDGGTVDAPSVNELGSAMHDSHHHPKYGVPGHSHQDRRPCTNSSSAAGATGGDVDARSSGDSSSARGNVGHSHRERGHGGGHSLRNDHIHLQHPQPSLHLRRPHAPHVASSSAAGGEAATTADAAATAAPPGLSPPITSGTRCRFIFLRGVQWSAHDTNTLSLSASLAAFWPASLLATEGWSEAAANSGNSNGVGSSRSSPDPELEHLVAHSGVAAMARELLPALLPHIRDAAAAGVERLVFAGHSLGGSLAKLLWAISIAQGHRSPDATSCQTFGSPPVLAHTAGGGGARVLRLLRSPPDSIVNWVLEHDPVPRAMLTADPYFSAARRAVPGLAALLDLRGAVLGEGAALSSGRFLYETVGEVLLLRWSTKGGCEVVAVSEAETETLLRLALDEAMTAPVRSLQYWLDHHHASYHHDLETAALAACRRQARSQQCQQHQQPAEVDGAAAAGLASEAIGGSEPRATGRGSVAG